VKKRAYLILFFILTSLDLATKYWALNQSHSPWVITSFLEFTFSLNCGIAFGFLSTCTWLGQGLLGMLALFICGYLIKYHTSSTSQRIATAFIVSGAIGNVISRLIHKGVIDFISLHYQNIYWPTFNLADTWIFIGACLLILFQSIEKKHKPH
jgi:signal peptidase II